jgi:UDP-N-acetylmuramyl pentapeptide synthase
MEDEHDIAIIEAGISQPDEMDNLQKIIKPDIEFLQILVKHTSLIFSQ